MELRPYQQEAFDKIVEDFSDRDRLLAVLPTGSGKTILFAHLANHYQPERTLILAHREELIDQAVDKVRKATGIEAQVEMAECRASMEAPVVVASVQTMTRRRDRWPEDHFGLVVVDEAHHTLADSYLNTLGRFNSAKVLGVTATPDRGDKKKLGKYYEDIAVEIGMARLIREGWLSRIKVRRVPIEIDLRSLRKVAGDYRADDVDEAIAPSLEDVAEAIAVEAWACKTIVFLPLVKTAREFARLLESHGLEARAVAGEDPSNQRTDTLQWFVEAGPGSVLCNAMLLTEGYDQPDVDCIVCLRPTEIRSLFAQMVGRGTRIWSGKDHLLLLDFLWLTEEHNLVTPASLVAENEEDAVAIDARLGDGTSDLMDVERDVEAERLAKLRERLKQNQAKARLNKDMLELYLALEAEELIEYEPITEWHRAPVTPKQQAMLEKAGFSMENIKCRGHASMIIGRLVERRQQGLATPKQVRLLKRFGHKSPQTATFAEANDFLDHKLNPHRNSESVIPRSRVLAPAPRTSFTLRPAILDPDDPIPF
jgi:superfamily II DNA or RNA helicase